MRILGTEHFTDRTISVKAIKLDTYTSYDKRTTPMDFHGQGSKVNVTRYTLLYGLVNTKQT